MQWGVQPEPVDRFFVPCCTAGEFAAQAHWALITVIADALISAAAFSTVACICAAGRSWFARGNPSVAGRVRAGAAAVWPVSLVVTSVTQLWDGLCTAGPAVLWVCGTYVLIFFRMLMLFMMCAFVLTIPWAVKRVVQIQLGAVCAIFEGAGPFAALKSSRKRMKGLVLAYIYIWFLLNVLEGSVPDYQQWQVESRYPEACRNAALMQVVHGIKVYMLPIAAYILSREGSG